MKTFFGVLLILATGLVGIPVLVVDVFGVTEQPGRQRIDVMRENGLECSRPIGQNWTCYRIDEGTDK